LRIEKKKQLSEDVSMADTFPSRARDVLPAGLRRERIRLLLDERGFVRVRDLRDSFDISGVTARADLDALVREGAAQRVHGGAVPVAGVALELEPAIPRFSVILTGGSLRPLQHSLVEPLADTVLSQVHADLAFIGCNGVDARNGVTNINLPEAGVKARMLDATARAIVVADSSKLGRTHLGRIGPISRFDSLVTDAAADSAELDSLREAGLTVLAPQ
jgi:DeoR/GlpR family transcriptional regulator of sugar metabolism